ncbi:ubiquitin-conjugating enzyme E2Q-like protein 1 [Teleopsis dalmanni]|uniref:ubiquitin-conjugating enzyme E2Q-like protein 1 n=1 Tax=Teleopsis dalmanni TaxID=139649 RepID=UPI000D32B84F|nr:ubiquitin-conjugating enzyme E2Q-like protein 1 [Teleopsis dalmanni]XP_037959949.1 ubiquitin-conjugating enzyme E2Q-like protein 1 [Teleopsis dalmanni]
MSSRSKEKVTAAIRKFFKGNDKVEAAEANATGAADSPNRRGRRQDNKVAPATSTKGEESMATISLTQMSLSMPDNSIRARRLMKEYKEIVKMQTSTKQPVFTVELIGDNLFEWYARLFIIDPDSKLAKDMAELKIPFILLHLVFPDNFPFSPPFMRVAEPPIERGFVMEGGAICMELLTPRGWASAYTVEAVIMQFAASLAKGQGRVVRKPKSTKEFNRRTAEESFRSLVRTHEKYGWVTPALSDG